MKLRPIFFPIGPSIAYVPLTKGNWSLIESDDVDLVGRYNWHAAYARFGGFYAATRLPKCKGRRIIGMHRVIMNCPENLLVDHVHRNTLDNRRHALRIASCAENNCNRIISHKNTSGFKGASWNKRDNRWRSYIKVNKKQKHLGLFETAEEANAAYFEAAKKLHGEFARSA